MKRWIPALLIAVLSLSPVATLASYAQPSPSPAVPSQSSPAVPSQSSPAVPSQSSPGAPSQSSPGAPSQEKGTYKHERGMNMLDQLGLSQKQKDQIRALREEEKQKHQEIRADYKKKMDAILTPEQRTKLDQMRSEYKGKRRGGEGSNY